MIEFNPDGSLKLPDSVREKIEKEKFRMTSARCIRIHKDLENHKPKTCKLYVTVSDAITDVSFVENITKDLSKNSEVPIKFTQITEKEMEIIIGTEFLRCTECNKLISRFREFLDGNVIEEQGTCTWQKREFDYEDYFD
jgi:hypothetical protein